MGDRPLAMGGLLGGLDHDAIHVAGDTGGQPGRRGRFQPVGAGQKVEEEQDGTALVRAPLRRDEIAKRIGHDPAPPVRGGQRLDGLQHMRMGADHGSGPGLERGLRQPALVGVGAFHVLLAPMGQQDRGVDLRIGAQRADRGQNFGLIAIAQQNLPARVGPPVG